MLTAMEMATAMKQAVRYRMALRRHRGQGFDPSHRKEQESFSLTPCRLRAYVYGFLALKALRHINRHDAEIGRSTGHCAGLKVS